MSFNESVIDEFRANGGKVGGPFAGGELLLLTTTGARSGRQHTVPLGCVRVDNLVLVVGSAGGAHRHPAWYHNLLGHPLVQVELGVEAFHAVAIPAEGIRRDELFARVVAVASGYADYQATTSRVLPVVVLERAGQGEDLPPVTTLADKLLEVHGWLRAQLRLVRAEVDAHFVAHHGTSAPPALGLQLRQHCLAFCQSLQFHHTGEESVFPTVGRWHPELRDVLTRLGEEHRTVARINGDLLALLSDIGTAVPGRFRADLDRLTVELHAHLDYEEATLLPA